MKRLLLITVFLLFALPVWATTFTGTITIDGAVWTGTVETVGVGRDYATLSEAQYYHGQQPTVYLIYDDVAGGIDTSYPVYIRGMGANRKITLPQDGSLPPEMKFEYNSGNGYLDNLYITVGTGGTKTIETCNGVGPIKMNKVKIERTNTSGFVSLLESCGTSYPLWNLQYVSLIGDGNTLLTDFEYGSGFMVGTVFNKVAYSPAWNGFALDTVGITHDLAPLGTAGYGYDYGTEGALIQVTEGSTSGFLPWR